jgi:hypothetical protein
VRTTLADVRADSAPQETDTWSWSPRDVRASCRSVRASSAPGPDGFQPVLLHHLGPRMYAVLARLFEISWSNGVLPTQWREANVIALYKGSGDRSTAASYRPISMTSAIIRVFERLIRTKLTALLEGRRQFSDEQFGFRAQRSTSDAIAQLIHCIRSAYEHSAMLPVTFLDLRKAFDRVWHERLLVRLAEAGVKGRAWRWIAGFLADRRFRVVDRSVASDWLPSLHGVPQGCVLSPTLFLVFIEPVARLISEQLGALPKLRELLYADDVAFCYDAPAYGARQPRPSMVHASMSRALTRLDKWALENRMEFNHAKCVTVVFSRHLASNVAKCAAARDLASLSFPARSGAEARPLSVDTRAKYLGLVFDRRLDWRAQSDAAVATALATASQITRVIRPASPPGPLVVRRLVLGLLLPQITYALEHWQPSTETFKRLRSAAIRPLAKSLALPYTSNHASLLAEFDVPSLPLTQQKLRLRVLERALHLPEEHPTHTLLLMQRRTIRPDLSADHVRSLLLSVLQADVGLTRSHTLLQSPRLREAYNSAFPLDELPDRSLLSQLLSAANVGRRYQIKLTPPPDRDDLARAARLLSLDEWRSTARATSPLLLCMCSPSLPFYLSLDPPVVRRVRARLRHDRALTQAYRHMCFGRDREDPRFVEEPNCLADECRRDKVVESGRHAALNCPILAGRVARLRADLVEPLGFDPTDDDLWLLLLGCHPDPDAEISAQILSITGAYLTEISAARKRRNRLLMPLAYPLCAADAAASAADVIRAHAL